MILVSPTSILWPCKGKAGHAGARAIGCEKGPGDGVNLTGCRIERKIENIFCETMAISTLIHL
jgi:hypothetical protein